METKEFSPQYYWQIAKNYIIKQSKYLEENEPKYYLDKDLAYNYIKFGSMMKLTAGELAGKNFRFMEWQIKAIIDIFATKHKDGEFKDLRRYQTVLFFLAKKGGKSTFGALLTVLYFFLDPEKAKECYSMASDLEQAKILHKAFTTMIKQEPELQAMVKTTIQPPRVSKYNGAFIDEYIALSSTADSKDGLNVSMALIDEPHAYPNKALYQIITDGMAGRREPLQIIMSTAGYNLEGFFYKEIYHYAKSIKNGAIKDDSFYQVMFEPDEKDLEDPNFWKNEEVWKKSNPAYPISPTSSYMKNKVTQAELSEESKRAFLTKHLNVWCDKANVWVPHKVWTQNQSIIDIEKLKGKTCYAGLDLAQTKDLAAFILIFPDDSQGFTRFDILCRFWIPKERMIQRIHRDKAPYFDFISDGLIVATEGDAIDYDYIEKQILQDCTDFNVKMLGFDRYNSNSLVKNLSDAECTTLVPYNQTTVWFNAPVLELETLAMQGRLNHQNNKVLNWNCANVVLFTDSSGNVKFDKAKSPEKIDGMVALAMAMGVCMQDRKEEEKKLIYNDRGLIDL